MLGWGEFELEVMRDRADNVVIVCSIENLDPMGVHTGDSVCVAPQQTLTDKQYQLLRDQAIAAIRAVGVETGGSNVQFAVNRATDEVVVIEMNPRVSRSSALASKATGFPIAKIAARLAVGYTLQEIPNDITRATPASFEPAIDYCVVKWPRFAFEKFPGAEAGLTTHMKSVGEAMAIGRTFKQAFAKALRSRELDTEARLPGTDDELLERLEQPGAERFDLLLEALRRGAVDRGAERRTEHRPVVPARARRAGPIRPPGRDPVSVRGRADVQVGRHVRGRVRGQDARTTTRAGSARRAHRPPSARGRARRAPQRRDPRLGAQPDRPGDRVRLLLRARRPDGPGVRPRRGDDQLQPGDGLDRLRHLRPAVLRAADARGRARRSCEVEQPEGVIVQFGGQTPLKLAAGLEAAGVPILGTSIDAIDLAEDRSRFGALLDRLGYKAPPYATASSPESALEGAEQVGFPLLVRPSYVLGGRAMEIVYSVDGLRDYLERVGTEPDADDLPRPLPRGLDRGRRRRAVRRRATCGSRGSCSTSRRPGSTPATPPACCRRTRSGDEMLAQIREQTEGIARALGVVGLLNVQFAIHGQQGLHVIEANPRASRTVPFVSKAIGLPLAKLACRILLGERIADLDLPRGAPTQRPRVRQGGGAPVQPVRRRRLAARSRDALDRRGDGDRARLPDRVRQGAGRRGRGAPERRHRVHHRRRRRQARRDRAWRRVLHELGFRIVATRGTAQAIRKMGIPAEAINKIGEGSPHVVDWIERGDVDLVINTPVGTGARVRRLRDPHRRDRPRDPLHHDDGRRDGGRARDLGRAAGRARGALAPGDPRAANTA